jgi:hypothetical protein
MRIGGEEGQDEHTANDTTQMSQACIQGLYSILKKKAMVAILFMFIPCI